MDVVSRAMHIVLVCLVMDTVCSELMFDEPQCSKYHFEERLLEKVVRFENKLDSMQARVDSLAEHLTQEQRSLTDDRNQLLLDVHTLKDDMGSDSSALRIDIEAKAAATDSQFQELIRTTQLQVERISHDAQSLINKTSGDIKDDRNQLLLDVQTLKDDIVADVQIIKDELGSDSSALRTDIEAKQAATDSQFQELIRTTQLQVERISRDAQSLINKTSGDIKEPVSAFTVTYPKSAPSVNNVGHVLRFITVVYNGVEYDTNTGVFTCRHAGLYYFALSLVQQRISTKVNSFVYARIYKGTKSLILAYLDPTNDDTDKGVYETSTFVTTHLVPGDIVFVGGGTSVESIKAYSSFSGFLVNAD